LIIEGELTSRSSKGGTEGEDQAKKKKGVPSGDSGARFTGSNGGVRKPFARHGRGKSEKKAEQGERGFPDTGEWRKSKHWGAVSLALGVFFLKRGGRETSIWCLPLILGRRFLCGTIEGRLCMTPSSCSAVTAP